MGGLSLSIILGFEFIFCLIQSIRSKSVGPMGLIMYIAMAAGSSNDETAFILWCVFGIYRIVSNWIYLILLTIFSSLKFETAKIEDYETRNTITIKSEFGLFILIYTWITSFIWPYAGVFTSGSLGDEEVGTTGRTFGQLIVGFLWDDIMELREFGIRPMTAADVTEIDMNSWSGLDYVSYGAKKKGVTVNVLIILKDIVDIAPKTIEREHFLNPLELECKNSGGLLHLAVALTLISECRDESTQILQEIIE
eukprot:545476_1